MIHDGEVIMDDQLTVHHKVALLRARANGLLSSVSAADDPNRVAETLAEASRPPTGKVWADLKQMGLIVMVRSLPRLTPKGAERLTKEFRIEFTAEELADAVRNAKMSDSTRPKS